MELVDSTEKQMTWYKIHNDPQVKVRSMNPYELGHSLCLQRPVIRRIIE